MGRVGQREGRLAEYNPLWRVNARLVFPLPDTLFPTFSFTTASSSIYISPTSPLPSPSLSFLYSSIRLVAPVFLCGLLCSSMLSCSSLPVWVASVFRSVACSLHVWVAMQFHVQLLQSSCVGCIVGGFVGRVGRVGQREGRLAEYNPLWRVNARLVFPLPDTLFPTFSFTTASSSIYISPTSPLPSPSLSFLYSSIRLVAPAFLCGLLCSSMFS